MATLAFRVEADYDKVIKLRDEIKRLNEALADVSQNRTPEEIERLEKQLASAQSEMNKTVSSAAKLGSELDKSFSGGKALTGLEDMKESISLQIDYLDQLKRKYQEVSTSLQSTSADSKANKQLKNELAAIGAEIKEEDAALQRLQQQYDKLSKTSTPNLRQQMRELVNTLMQMRNEGQQNTEQYHELEQELGRLATIQRQVQQERRMDSTGATQISAWLEGVQGLAGAYTAASGAVGLFVKDQEKLAAIQTKMQSLMAILIGLQQASNALHSTSAFRLKALSSVQTAYNVIITKTSAGLQALGISAKAANVATKALYGTLTLGLTVAITAAISLWNKYKNAQEEAAEASKELVTLEANGREERLKAQVQLETYIDRIHNFNGTKEEEKALLNELNQKYGESFGYYDTLVQWYNALIQKGNAYIDVLFKQAKAQSLVTKAIEADEKVAEIEAKGIEGYRQNAWKRYWEAGVEGLKRSDAEIMAKAEEDYNAALKKAEAERDELLESAKELNKEIQEINKETGLGGFTRPPAQPTSTTTRTDNTQQVISKQEKERLRQITDMEFATRQAEIDLMQESSRKVMEQYRLDFEMQREQIDRWYEDLKDEKIKKAKELWDANPNNKGKQFDESTVDLSYTSQETTLYDARIAANESKYQEQRQKAFEDETRDMQAFLKEYGTYEQQRLAITEEYARKIAKASTLGEQMALQAQQEQETKNLDVQYSSNTNWAAMFGEIDKYSNQYLQKLQEQIQEMLSSEELTPEQAKVLADRLNQINKLLIENSRTWTDYFGIGNERLREQKKLEEDLLYLEQQRSQAIASQEEAQIDVDNATQAILDAFNDVGITLTVDDVDLSNAANLEEQLRGNGVPEGTTQEINQLWSVFGKAQSTYQKATQEVEKFDSQIEATNDQLTTMTTGLQASMDKVGDAANSMRKYVTYLNQMGDLADMFGLDGVSEVLGTLTEAGGHAIDAMDSFSEGDFVGAALSGISAVGTLISGLFSRESDPTLLKDIEYMTQANQDLSSAINNLSKTISDNTTSLADATEAYRKASEDLEQSQANTQEMLIRSGASHGGSHSADYYIDKAMSDADWKRISNIVGETITSAGQFWTLTSEQMYNVSTEAADLWTKIKKASEDGNNEVTEFMEDYITYWEQLDELTDTWNEKLTGTTFDSVYDNFKSNVMNMEHTTADFAQDFEDMMKEAMISSLLSASYASRLQQWYDDFKKAMENDNTLDAQEQEGLRNDYMEIVSDAKRDIEALYDTMGWSTSATQSASSKGFETMSQDTADELSGRFTALQIAGEDIRNEVTQMSGKLDESNMLFIEISSIADETRGILADSYLELQEINENTSNSARYLLDAVGYLKKVKENTDKL